MLWVPRGGGSRSTRPCAFRKVRSVCVFRSFQRMPCRMLSVAARVMWDEYVRERYIKS